MKQSVTLLGAVWLAYSMSACDSVSHLPALDEVVLEEVAIVGVLDGREEEVFGLIIDVRSLPDGSFLAADAQAARVQWFSSDGEYRGGFGGRGEGPGELQVPTALAIDRDEVVVVDRRNQRMEFFRFDTDGFLHDRSLAVRSFSPLNFPGGQALCGLDGDLYIRFPIGDHAVHMLGRELEVVTSFERVEPIGEVPFAYLLREQRSQGRLLCSSSPPVVVSMSDHSAWVRAFSLDGQLLWERELTELRPREITSSEETGIDYHIDPEAGSHRGLSILRWTDDSVLLQYELLQEGGPPEGSDRFTIESRELSIERGEEIGRTTTLPRIASTSGDFVYVVERQPFPRVLVLRRSGER